MGGVAKGGPAVRRSGGRWIRRTATLGAALFLSVSPTVRPSAAQVGHDPGHSPYRDVRRGGVGLITAGYFGGSRGRAGVGISNGPTGGLRYERWLGGAIGVSFGLAYGQTTRFVVDPSKDSLTRKTGPHNTDVILADVGLQLVLTGQKTWRGFAPYLGAAVGMALGGGSPPDSSGYQFGNKVTLAPEAGVRWYPTRRVSVRTDFRLVLWRLHYPLSYQVPGPDGSSVLPPDARPNEWTAHPWITIGLGWTF
jgi:hypothetical protein